MPIYSYAELKGKIKKGDTVRAVPGKDNPCGKLHDDGSNTRKITGVDDRWFDIAYCQHDFGCPTDFLELLTEEPKTLDTVDVGDVVVDSEGDERVILDKSPNGTVLFLSDYTNHKICGQMRTRHDLEQRGFTVKQAPQTVTMTREEAEKELSKDGKQVKIVEG